MSNKVFIKMIEHPSAQNKRHFIRDRKGRKEIKHVKSKGTNGAGLWRFTVSDKGRGRLNTGLEELMKNPWYDRPEQLPAEFNDGQFHKRENISKQEYFEIKTGKGRGDLTSYNRNIFSGPNEPTTFLQTFYRDFYETTILDLDDPIDELTYHLLLAAHPDKCANSFEERTPFTRVYVSKVDEDEQRTAAKADRIEKAIANLVDLKENYTETDIKKVAVVLNTIKGEVPLLKIKNSLSDYVRNKGDKQMQKVDKFIEVFESLNDKKGREVFEATYLLRELIRNRIVSDFKGKYVWNSKKGTPLELIGKSEQEVIGTFMDIDWRNYREELTEELKNKIDDDRLVAL